MPRIQKIAPCLWFDQQAEEAAKYDTGRVLTVAFELDGEPFTALNGGPLFQFNEAISFQIHCDTQKEIDYFWEKLRAGGDVAKSDRVMTAALERAAKG